jgi:two-component system, sensor histidine kinase LadS
MRARNGNRFHQARRALVRLLCGLLGSVFLCLASAAFHKAQAATANLPTDGEEVDLKGFIEVMPDPQSRLSIEQVKARTDEFEPLTGYYNAGQTGGVTWFHLRLHQPVDGHQSWRLLANPPFLTDIQLWAISDDGHTLIRQARSGMSVPIEQRPLALPVLAIPLGLKAGQTADIYIRLRSEAASILRLELRTPESLQLHASWMALFSGLVAGICSFTFFTSLIHFLWLKDKTFFWYCVFLLGAGTLNLFHTGGIAVLLPASLPQLATAIGLGSVPVSLCAFFIFLHHSLDIKGQSPRIYRLQRLVIALGALGGLSLIFVSFHSVAWYFGGLLILGVWSALYAGLRIAARGDRAALLITCAFFTSVLGSTVSALRAIGILDPGFLVEQAQTMAFLVQILLMSFGLAARLKGVTRDRLLAEEAARLTAEQSGSRALELVHQRTGELVAAKAELEMALVLERAALRQHAHFIDMISHEYRTPLAILSSSLETLMLEAPATPAASGATHGMTSALRRLRDIFETGLRQLGAENPTVQSRFENIAIVEMLIGVVEEARASYPDCRIDLSHDLPPSARLRADAHLLKVALMNLVTNACRFSASNELVTVEATGRSGRIIITVSDNGIGIPADELTKVTQKYFRARNGRSRTGSGLGLTIVERVARLHEGQLSLESREGAGTRARLTLPSSSPRH